MKGEFVPTPHLCFHTKLLWPEAVFTLYEEEEGTFPESLSLSLHWSLSRSSSSCCVLGLAKQQWGACSREWSCNWSGLFGHLWFMPYSASQLGTTLITHTRLCIWWWLKEGIGFLSLSLFSLLSRGSLSLCSPPHTSAHTHTHTQTHAKLSVILIPVIKPFKVIVIKSMWLKGCRVTVNTIARLRVCTHRQVEFTMTT